MDTIKAIGQIILICFGFWLFVKLVFHPMLFELDMRDRGLKGISPVMTIIQIAGIIAMNICYGKHDQEMIDASVGFAFIIFVVAAVFASKRAKKLSLTRKEKWMLILAQIFSPITILVILLLAALALEKIGNIISRIFGGEDDK